MATRVKNMTEGKPLPLIVSFALPLMMGNVFQQLYTVVDTMVVGKALGVSALAALGAADWLNWLMLGIIQGLTQGFAILMAKEFGARQYGSLRQVVGNSTVLAAISSVVFLAVGMWYARPVLELMDTPAQIALGCRWVQAAICRPAFRAPRTKSEKWRLHYDRTGTPACAPGQCSSADRPGTFRHQPFPHQLLH